MKKLKHLVIAGLMLVVASACEKDSLTTTVEEVPRYFTFISFDGEYLVSVTSDEILLYKWSLFTDCYRPVREGDLIPRVPNNPNIVEHNTYLEIVDIGVEAEKVSPWLVNLCD